MGLLFLFTVLVDDLNNVSQFITMPFCLSDILIKNTIFFKMIVYNYCLTVELLVYFNLIKIN